RDRNVTGVQTCALPIFGAEHVVATFTGVGQRHVQLHRLAAVDGFDGRGVVVQGHASLDVTAGLGGSHGHVVAEHALVVSVPVERSEERRVGNESATGEW